MENKPKLESKSASVEDAVESPTTARPLDFDDDEPRDNVLLDNIPPKPARSPKPKVSFADETDEAPPPKPPRPMSPQAHAEATLLEAFPALDAKVVKAVLVASGGKVEPAFNALLSMSDPDFQPEETPPPQPPRPTQKLSQVDADERYARQLAAHYDTNEGYGSRSRGDPPLPRQPRTSSLKPNELYDDREHSFFDDDLPVIRDNIKKGFLETQSTVNKWISDFKKKIDGDEDEDARHDPYQQRQNYGPSQSQQLYGIRKSAEASRRSADRERYDPDPRTLDDNFEALELRDDEAPRRTSSRPLANPDLFKPTSVGKVPSGPIDEVDALYRQPSPSNNPATGRQPSPGSAGKSGNKKWQPLTTIAPNPEAEDNNPFSLGDSDEEEEAKTKDIRAEDTERLKKAAANKEDVAEDQPKLQKAERSGSQGTKDKEVEDLLAGKKS